MRGRSLARRLARITAWLAGGLLLALLAAVGAGWLALSTERGQGWLFAELENRVAAATGWRLALTEPRLDGLSALSVARLELADRDGVWLTLDGLALAWHPAGLLDGVLAVDLIGATSLTVARRPAAAPASGGGATSGPLAWVRWLPRLRVERIDLPRIALAEPVAGFAATVQALVEVSGTVEEGIETRFRLAELDRGAASLRGRARLRPNLAFELDADAADAAGGLVAHLLERPALPALEAHLDGAGPLDAWSGELALSLAGSATLAGSITADLRAARVAALRLELTPGPGFAALAGVALVQPVSLAAAGALREGGLIAIERLALSSGSSRLSLTGGLRPPDRLENLNLEADLARGELALLTPPPLDVERLRLTATLNGPLAGPELAADARLEQPALARMTADAVDCRVASAARGPRAFDLDCTAAGLAGAPRLARMLGDTVQAGAKLSLAPDGAALTVDEAELQAKTLTLTGRGRVEGLRRAGLPAVTASVDLALADLGALDALTGVPLRGALAGTIEAAGEADGALRGHLSLRSANLASGDPALAGLAAGRLELESDYVWRAADGLGVERLTLSTPWASLAGSGRFDPAAGRGAGSAKLRIADLTRIPVRLPVPLAGDATADVKVESSGGGLSFTLATAHEALAVERFKGEAIRTELAGTLAPSGALAATLRVGGTLQAEPLALSASLALSERRQLRLDDVALEVGGFQVHGRLEGAPGGRLWQGRIEAEQQDLGRLSSLAGVDLGGALDLAVELTAADGRQAVAWRLALADATLAAGTRGALADRVESSGRLDDAFGQPRLGAELKAAGLVTPKATLERLSLSAAGGPERLDLEATLAGEAGMPVTAEAGGRIALAGDGATLDLATLSATLGTLPVRLRRPVRLELAGPSLRLAEAELAIGEGRIRLAGRSAPAGLELELGLDALDPGPLAALAGAPALSGRLDGTAALAWHRDSQRLTATLAGRELRLADLAGDYPAATLDLQADWDGRSLAVNSTLSGIGETPVRFEARLPVVAGAAPPELALSQAGRIEGKLEWQGALERIAGLLPLPEHRLAGAVQVSVTADGPAAAPELAGTATLKDGSYEHLIFGTLLRNLEVTMRGDQSGALAVEGQGTDGGEGRFEVSGRAELGRDSLPKAEVTLRLQRMRMLRRDEVKAVVSSEVAAKSDGKAIALTGTVTANRLDISIANSLPASVTDLEVREINGAGPADTEAKRPRRLNASLDLTVSIPNQAFVRGRGLDSEWKGELKVTGTTGEPRITGALELVRGKFGFAGRSFEIDRGRIVFDGGRKIDPELDIAVRHEREDLRAEIRIEGRASKPKLVLTSSPELPQDEILARIVFGKSVAELSPVQALQLAQSVAEVTGVAGGGGAFSRIREGLGIDVLTVDNTDQEGPRVGIGKYVLDNVYLGVSRGARPGSDEVEAVIAVTPNINVRSTLGSEAEGGIGVEWKMDY